ncbi:hypothetical protein NQ317_008190 [Molorchus minor]|uniref:Uncharacterized protein n=1 Tax=Molorchus minor TaxID=1323400 RepID=A0ABQ9J4Y2_9CUCU|nr:hypothetical protein NQ317_008190 [Molorchus minor]
MLPAKRRRRTVLGIPLKTTPSRADVRHVPEVLFYPCRMGTPYPGCSHRIRAAPVQQDQQEQADRVG